MKITITVKANAKQDAMEEITPGEWRVSVKAPPHEGRANEAVIKVLARHFKVPKSQVIILTGQSTKRKLVRIND